MEHLAADRPCYVISIVSEMLELHPQTLRRYERIGLVTPARSAGNVRLYSPNDVERLRKICRLTDELGVNLAGVDIIMRLTQTIEELQDRIQALQANSDQPHRSDGNGLIDAAPTD